MCHFDKTFFRALRYGRTTETGTERFWKMFPICQCVLREPKLQADTLVYNNCS